MKNRLMMIPFGSILLQLNTKPYLTFVKSKPMNINDEDEVSQQGNPLDFHMIGNTFNLQLHHPVSALSYFIIF